MTACGAWSSAEPDEYELRLPWEADAGSWLLVQDGGRCCLSPRACTNQLATRHDLAEAQIRARWCQGMSEPARCPAALLDTPGLDHFRPGEDVVQAGQDVLE